MRQPLLLVAALCLIGTLLTAPAWPQTGAEWRIDTLAGGLIGDGRLAVQAQLERPANVAVDDAGNLYIADRYHHRIRRVDSSGIITTVAGTGERGSGGDGGPAVQAQLAFPSGCGRRQCRKPLYCRFLQPPHPPGGFLGDYHHCRGWWKRGRR